LLQVLGVCLSGIPGGKALWAIRQKVASAQSTDILRGSRCQARDDRIWAQKSRSHEQIVSFLASFWGAWSFNRLLLPFSLVENAIWRRMEYARTDGRSAYVKSGR